MKSTSISIALLVLGSASLLGCSDPSPDLTSDGWLAAASPELDTSDVMVYKADRPVPESELFQLDPAAFGGEIMDPGVTWSGRFDLLEGAFVGGVFQATRGRYRVLYPGVVHGTIIVGNVSATVQGVTHQLHRGDSFLVTKGTEVVFETTTDMHQASFMGHFGSPDAPADFIVYRQGSAAGEDELSSVGTPADFNATVLEGDPSLDGRIDYAAEGELAGIFRATRSKLFIAGTPVTEHGAVLRYRMTLTGGDGIPHKLNPGDAYIVRSGRGLLLEIDGPSVQESFFAVRAP